MKLRRADNVGLVSRVRRVDERESDGRDRREEARTWEQPAVTVALERRCPTCRAVCEDESGAGCPVAARHPEEHRAAADLVQRVRAEKNRHVAAFLTGQLQTLLGRLRAG